MEDYGKSLHIDDVMHVPATHYTNARVPRETACFSCHTTYTMYGDWAAKLKGLEHVYVYYLGKVPERIKLYQPFHNRECLHCHEGARTFEEGKTHRSEPGQMEKIKSNQLSCLTAKCHDVSHDVANVAKLEMWRQP
jgi:hypothetical protein